MHIKTLTDWADKDSKGSKKSKFKQVTDHFLLALYLKQVITKNDIILKVEEQSRLEKMINYEDRWPLLNLRKSINKMIIYINMGAEAIIQHKAFESACITVILLNSATLSMEDPLAVSTEPW